MTDLTQTLNLEDLSPEDLLTNLIDGRKAMAWLKAQEAALLDRLDELAAAGEIDQGGFTHNDWRFDYSDGKTVYTYPEQITELEAQLTAAKDAAKANGTAVKGKGKKAFWTITPPKP